MPKVISELITSLDMAARGRLSPGYFGYIGPEFGEALRRRNAEDHRMLIGRKTYELLNNVPESARDDGWLKTTKQPGYLFSRRLEKIEWTGPEIVRKDMIEFVRDLKNRNGSDLRVLGSLSIARQLAAAGLLDEIRLYICPLVVPATGLEPAFADWDDTAFALVGCEILDERVIRVDYRLDGRPPKTSG